MASRVVPGIADTMVRVSPSSALSERALADVGSAHDGHPHGGGLFFAAVVRGQTLDYLVEQVPHAKPVLRGYAKRLTQAQLPVLVQHALGHFGVLLVDRQDHRHSAPPEHVGDLSVLGHDARLALHHEDGHSGFGDGQAWPAAAPRR